MPTMTMLPVELILNLCYTVIFNEKVHVKPQDQFHRVNRKYEEPIKYYLFRTRPTCRV
jgi:hypothetical protein